jgi:RNA polymerase-binding transcription factor DksA
MDHQDEARARLDAEATRVRDLIDEVRAEVDEATEEQHSELATRSQHPADSGSELFEREKELTILESLERELAEIQAAIERIEQGTYGIDEETGEPIDPARLEAMPTARTNVHPDPRR